MCCIFTCCGWMIDLLQRLWTFTMSCCISSAVCCALGTAAMAGIALGYNYSLAEYIDLKETNVSVYLKRGIFDDEIGDDMNWRRSGHQPVAGHIGENNHVVRNYFPSGNLGSLPEYDDTRTVMTGEREDDSSTIRSGRRLDDSIYESDDRNRFEGSLMKLTAKPPAPSPTSESQTTVDTDEILSKYSAGSLDQMKALQTLINMGKYADPRLGKLKVAKETTKTSEYAIDERYLPHAPLDPNQLVPGRKYIPLPPVRRISSTQGNSARLAVPQEPLNEKAKWRLPKLPPEAFTTDDLGDYDARPTFPMPVTQRAGPVRPTRPKPTARPRSTLKSSTQMMDRREPIYPKSIDEDMDTFKEKLLFDAPPSIKEDILINDMKGSRQDDDDYGDAIKGIPMRKKRHIMVVDTLKNGSNKSFLNNSSIDNTQNMKVNDNTLLYRLRKSLTNALFKNVNNKVLSRSDTNPQAISTSSGTPNTQSSNIVVLTIA